MRLYDSAAKAVRDFTPLEPGKVSMYVCGATVQSSPHVGHIRSGVAFDVLLRWFKVLGYDVTLVRNVTDIDDKILAKEQIENRPWWAVAAHYEREFQEAYRILGCAAPTVEPRATGHITQMITLMETLIERGHAYVAGSDVYFDVRSFAEYGQLSGQKIDDLLPAADSAADSRKKDPRDFALWKSVKPGEPSWPTPWGDGRPGWHLECSAMAEAYLGKAFDIHGGGLDLVFPHHENEVAQSKASGADFANFWLHNAWVTMSGEKMSKSLGNSLVVTEVVKRVRPIELRWYLAGAHYRSNLEFGDAALQESAVAFQRIENFVRRATDIVGDVSGGNLPPAFVSAMNDDLNIPAALAVLHESVTAGNTLLAKSATKNDIAASLADVRAMLDVIGVDPLADMWASSNAGASEELTSVVEHFVQERIATRQAAKAEKDFGTADAIRDELRNLGIALEDGAEGVRWTLEK